MEGYYNEGKVIEESTRLLQEKFVKLCESYGYKAYKITYSDIAYGVKDERGYFYGYFDVEEGDGFCLESAEQQILADIVSRAAS